MLDFTGVVTPLVRDRFNADISGLPVPNAVMDSAAAAVIKLLGGDIAYKVAAFYFEFENGTTGAISNVTFNTSDDRSYYDNLSGARDYVYVPVIGSPTFATEGTTPTATWAGFADATAGVHGLPFTATAGSRVFGGALVVSPVQGQRSSDIIYARAYWGATPWVITDGRQVGTRWKTTGTITA